jgi:hypothetical protein
MNNGTIAATVITDLITSKQNQFVELFDPLRFRLQKKNLSGA